MQPMCSLCVCECVCGRGRTKSAGADSGEHGRGLIAAPTSVLERRCQKFPGGLRTPAPAFHLPLFVFPSLPTSLPSLPPFFFPFSPRSECSAVDLLTLIPRSSLLTCPSDCMCVWVCACAHAMCVCDAKRQDLPTAIWGERDVHTHSDKLIDE